MLTPLVIAMPKPMAEALGYPNTPIGFTDIVALAKDPQGWAKFGHPEWGPFRLGKTNPNFSTSGLNFTLSPSTTPPPASRTGLTNEDLARPDVEQLRHDVENAVVHYGDTTLTFLNNWYRADARGTALTYTSAVAVEEKSVIDYNTRQPRRRARTRVRCRARRRCRSWPSTRRKARSSPTTRSSSWTRRGSPPSRQQGAQLFRDFVLQPGEPGQGAAVRLPTGQPAGGRSASRSSPPTASTRTSRKPCSRCPHPTCSSRLLDQWAEQRKPARVLLVIDVSGSMGDPATPGRRATKLELAKQAAIASLGSSRTTTRSGCGSSRPTRRPRPGATPSTWCPSAADRPATAEALAQRIDDLVPHQRHAALRRDRRRLPRRCVEAYDPAKINAVVLLTDGRNEDGTRRRRRPARAAHHEPPRRQRGREHASRCASSPSPTARTPTSSMLRRIAEATNARRLRRQQPVHHQPGVRRRGVELLMAGREGSSAGGPVRR